MSQKSFPPKQHYFDSMLFFFLPEKKKTPSGRLEKTDKNEASLPQVRRKNKIECALPWFVEAKPLGGQIKGESMLGISRVLFSLAYPHKKDGG